MESITPRTDSVAEKQNGILCGGANLEFARQLETELIALQRWKEEHWDNNKQQWLNSVTAVCADFPNIAEYISKLEKERQQLVEICNELKNALADANNYDCSAEGENAANFRHKRKDFDDLNVRAGKLLLQINQKP